MEVHIGICSVPTNFHCRKWAQALARCGAKVSVFTLDEPIELVGVECVKLPISVYKRDGTYHYINYALSAEQLGRIAAKMRVTHLHPLHLTPFGSWAVWSGFPKVVSAGIGADVLGYPPQEMPEYKASEWQEKPKSCIQLIASEYFRRQVQRVCDRSVAITADNNTILHALYSWFNVPETKARLIRWGQDFDELTPKENYINHIRKTLNLKPDERIILSPRGMKSFYQADIIFQAFKELLSADEGSRYHYVMLGAGYETNHGLMRAADRLASQHPCFHCFKAPFSAQEMAAIWSLTDIFISAPFFDGYSAALAEGRYVGAIPIVNDIAGNREVIEHGYNGIIIDAFTTQNLTATIRHTLQHLHHFKTMFSARNKKWIVENSDLTKNAASFLDYIAGI